MNAEHPPGFPAGPVLAQEETEAWDRYPLRSIESATQEYGDVFTVHRAGKPPRILVGDPAALRAVFVDHEADMRVQGSSLLQPLVGTYSLGTLNGEEHKRYRKLLAPPIHGAPLRRNFDRIKRVVETEIAGRPAAVPFSLRDVSSEVALRVMILYCFGDLPAERVLRLSVAFSDAMAALRTQPVDRALFGAGVAALNEAIAAEIDAAKSHPIPDQTVSILGRLLAAETDPDVETLGSADEKNRVVRDQLVTMSVSGMESTPTAFVNAVLWACREPDLRRRLVDELATVRKTVDVVSLPLLNAFCAEVLRVTSVVPTGITRHTPTGFRAAGYEFPAGTHVAPSIHAVHRRPELYPDPETFDPERFLQRKFAGTEYMPYGLGTRRCLGASLASAELKIVLATILTRPGLEVRLNGRGQELAESFGPTVAATDNIELIRKGDDEGF